MSKNLRHFIFYFLTIFIVISSINNGLAQSRYWVNGTGTWDDSNHWAETTGGKQGASIPTENDNVIFDNNSFTENNQTVIIKEKAICNDFRWEVDKYKPELKSSSFLFKSITKAELEVHGSLIIGENIENEFFGDLILKSSKKQKISSDSELNSNIIIQAKNGECFLEKSLKTRGNVELIEGTLITNDQKVECNSFIGTGNKNREIDFGKSEIIVNSWDFEETENLAYKSDEFILIYNNKFNLKDFKLGELTYGTIIPKGGSKAIFGIDSIPEIPVSCNGGNDGSITVYVSGGVPNYIYELYDGPNASYPLLSSVTQPSTSCQFIDLVAKTYYVIAKESGTGGISGTQTVVTEPLVFSAGSITVTNPLTCFDGNDAELEANPTGGNPPYMYTWFKYNFGTSTYELIAGEISKTIAGLSQGLYKVEVRDQKGCGTGGFVQTEYALIRGYDDVNVPDSIHISSITSTNSC
ncbi:MAG: SprB repeat-containing protein, partial [Bacteroidales bacterium]|nr:SprB repeat-containing protein [Bacteroidales bacterium]